MKIIMFIMKWNDRNREKRFLSGIDKLRIHVKNGAETLKWSNKAVAATQNDKQRQSTSIYRMTSFYSLQSSYSSIQWRPSGQSGFDFPLTMSWLHMYNPCHKINLLISQKIPQPILLSTVLMPTLMFSSSLSHIRHCPPHTLSVQLSYFIPTLSKYLF